MSTETGIIPTGWPEHMRVATAARYADCSVAMIRKLLRDPVDPLPSFRLGADIRIARVALDAYLARRMGAAISADAILEEIRASRRA